MLGHKTKHRRQPVAAGTNESRQRRIQSSRRYAVLVKMQTLDTAQIAELHHLAVYLGKDDQTVKSDRAAAMKLID
jgi:hypothetical protein